MEILEKAILTADWQEAGLVPQTAALAEAGPDFGTPLGSLVRTAVVAVSDSPNTQRAYKTSIGQFFQYLGEALESPKPLAEPHQERPGAVVIWSYRGTAEILRYISPSLLDGFFSWLVRRLAASTANSRYAAVKTFLGICYRDGYLIDSQAQRMGVRMFTRRLRKHEKPVGRRLRPAEVKKLRTAVSTDMLKGKRDMAIIDCMLFGGLRRDEVCSLEIRNLQQDGGRYWLVIEGKGNKTRRVKLPDVLYQSLTTWIDAAGKALAYNEPVFEGMSRHGRLTGCALDGSAIGRLVARYGAAAELAPAAGDNALSPHDLRRTAARNAHDNGAALLLIQKFLGHRDPKTTARYIGLDEDDSDTAADYIKY